MKCAVTIWQLTAMWDSLKHHWTIVLGCVIIAAAIIAVLALTPPQKWGSVRALQIGQLPTPITTLIEPTTQSDERFKQRQLQGTK